MLHCSLSEVSVNCLLQEKDNGWPKVLDIYFENNDTVAFSWEEAITIEDTGMYYLWFVICDDELSAATVRGQTTWKNPTGDLVLHRQPLQALYAGSVWALETPFHVTTPPRTVRATSHICEAWVVLGEGSGLGLALGMPAVNPAYRHHN